MKCIKCGYDKIVARPLGGHECFVCDDCRSKPLSPEQEAILQALLSGKWGK